MNISVYFLWLFGIFFVYYQLYKEYKCILQVVIWYSFMYIKNLYIFFIMFVQDANLNAFEKETPNEGKDDDIDQLLEDLFTHINFDNKLVDHVDEKKKNVDICFEDKKVYDEVLLPNIESVNTITFNSCFLFILFLLILYLY